MSEGDRFELRSEVKALLDAIGPQSDGIGLSTDALEQAAKTFTGLTKEDRQDVATQLVMVGVELERKGAKGIDLMLAQLVMLVRHLVGSIAKASDLFSKARAAPPPKEKIELPPAADPSKLWK